MSSLIDQHGRQVKYLRLSITDRCNFRCQYCNTNNEFIPHDNILRYEELLTLAKIAHKLGIKKIRLTGGEPFVRKGFDDFLQTLRQNLPDVDLRITSNGSLIQNYIPELVKAKINAVNISLDSFIPEVFAKLTGSDSLNQVLTSIDALLEAKIKVKINAVALKNINSNELKSFLDLAYAKQIEVRFIEFMPIGENNIWSKNNFWSSDEILSQAKKLYQLSPISNNELNSGPATLYSLNNSNAMLGLISPLSNHYCNSCNRLRLTSDGKLRTCLFDDKEYNLRPILRHKKLNEKHIEKILTNANIIKPIGNNILQQNTPILKQMSKIGG